MATEVRMPQLGLTMEEGTVTKWVKEEGDQVNVGDVIAEITTDKLTTEIESEVNGVLLKTFAKIGEDIPVKGLLGVIGQPGENFEAETYEEEHKQDETKQIQSQVNVKNIASLDSSVDSQRRIKISPLAKKIANKRGIDYSNLSGTGPGGRIIQKDILKASEQIDVKSLEKEELVQNNKPSTITKVALMEGDSVENILGMRKVVSERMMHSHTEIPSVTQTMKINVTNLLNFRKELNENRMDKLSINDFILKAVAKALRKNSNVLVSIDGNQIIKRAHVNLGMAVALEEGLIVPVIRDADKMSLTEISDSAKELAAKAREGTLGMDEYSGSTFTVSNMGMYGIESFTPIINQPDAAILGVNEIQGELDLDDNGNVYKRQVIRVSMTYDHRLMDGAVAAKFKLTLKELLENPMEIVL